ncbi:MAG: DUF134 domain-containing protein [Candidatus Thorarchaeota archaeon]
MHRRRKGNRGRFPVQPRISGTPMARRMIPEPADLDKAPLRMDLAEMEALRLVDIEGLYQEQAGVAMGVSRGTVWRLLTSAREKIARSIMEGRMLIIGFNENE